MHIDKSGCDAQPRAVDALFGGGGAQVAAFCDHADAHADIARRGG